MGAESKIEWTNHTFNPWWGCTRVSPGCEHCYAEAFAKRTGHRVWGATAPRRFFGEKHWEEPLKWNRDAERAGIRARVFCASMADWAEDPVTARYGYYDSLRVQLDAARAQLWSLAYQTPWLEWLLLTKRPENAERLAIAAWGTAFGYATHDRVPSDEGMPWLPNMVLGTTCEDQQRAEERLAALAATTCRRTFASCEPLLGPLNLFGPALNDTGPFGAALVKRHVQSPTDYGTGVEHDVELTAAVDWVIVGSESGPGARRMDVAWARSIVDQCKNVGVPVFVKQIANESDRKGGNPEFWPTGDWPREFPEVRT